MNEPIDPAGVEKRTDAQVSLSNDIDRCIKRAVHEFDMTTAEIVGVLENVKFCQLYNRYANDDEDEDAT